MFHIFLVNKNHLFATAVIVFVAASVWDVRLHLINCMAIAKKTKLTGKLYRSRFLCFRTHIFCDSVQDTFNWFYKGGESRHR